MRDEQALREKALEFLNGQRPADRAFYDAITRYIAEIPVSRVGMKYCPACESAVCGICGTCHELDHQFLFIGPACPAAVSNYDDSNRNTCVAWSWAYDFHRRAERVLNR